MSAPGFGVYFHWPYCTAICPYCAFNVHRDRGADHQPLLAAMIADLEAHAARFGPRRAASVYFGGGTPSLLKGAEITRLIEAARACLALEEGAEITLEANPEDRARFAEFVAAGVNRLSLGLQALDDGALAGLGRWHDAAAGQTAAEEAARTGARVSLDLIYAREGQSVADWRAELNAALELPAEHVSLYQLTIEPGTAFARKAARGKLEPPGDEHSAVLYEATQDVCAQHGFEAYEISNHARGAEARARHNLVYWRGGEWAGIGPGAHGRWDENGARVATEAQRRPADYIDAVRESGFGWITETALSAEETADEVLIMGLRTDEGADVARIEALRGRALAGDALSWLIDNELVAVAEGRVRLLPRARLIADRIAAELAV